MPPVKPKDRKYHRSILRPDGTLDKELYDALGDDLKGHEPNCAWEGHLDAKTCGCTKKGKK